MFMVSYNINNTVIHVYKHRLRRRHINIDENGQCYAYQGNGFNYTPIPDKPAIDHAFS